MEPLLSILRTVPECPDSPEPILSAIAQIRKLRAADDAEMIVLAAVEDHLQRYVDAMAAD